MDQGCVRLLLIRHGQVAANRSFRYLGRRDDRLDETGIDQARALASSLVGLPIQAVVSSPLRRATATAEAIAARIGRDVEIDNRLIELDFGEWDGKTRDEVADSGSAERAALAAWEQDPRLAVPGGESLAAVQQRALELANELSTCRAGETVVVTTHMGPVKTLLLAALGMPLTAAARIFLDPATVSVVDWGERPVVRLVNGHGHLGFAEARWLQES